jgi:uncharacterized membrane protein
MYTILLFLHSLFRWLVLLSLIYATFRAYTGLRSGRPFAKADDSIRHWTATIAHIQLTIGCILYFTSPLIRQLSKNLKEAASYKEPTFFGIIHLSLMLTAIVVITIGSALAKRATTDKDKFRTMQRWFSIAMIIIFIAIPWPFSPFAHRPLFRTF